MQSKIEFGGNVVLARATCGLSEFAIGRNLAIPTLDVQAGVRFGDVLLDDLHGRGRVRAADFDFGRRFLLAHFGVGLEVDVVGQPPQAVGQGQLCLLTRPIACTDRQRAQEHEHQHCKLT